MAKKKADKDTKVEDNGQKPKQQRIPGTEPPSIPELDRVAEDYVSKRDGRMALLREEIEAKNRLHVLMKDHGETFYEFEDYIVTLDAIEKVKVKKQKVHAEGEDEEADE